MFGEQPFYNYYETTLHLNLCEKNVSSHGFVKMPFVSLREPNLKIGRDSYKTTNLWIVKGRHGGDDNGELIVEHSPVAGGLEHVFSVFQLKTIVTTDDNNNNNNKIAHDLDEIIEKAGSNNSDGVDVVLFNLNEIIKRNSSHSKKSLFNIQNNVCYFNSPIFVRSSFQHFVSVDVGIDKKTVVNAVMKEGFINEQDKNALLTDLATGLNAGNAVIKCSPIDESDTNDNVQYVPITKEKTTFGHDLFVVFFVILLLCFAGIMPVIMTYNYLRTLFPENMLNVFNGLTIAFLISLGVYLFSMTSSIANMFGMVIVIFVVFSAGISTMYRQFGSNVAEFAKFETSDAIKMEEFVLSKTIAKLVGENNVIKGVLINAVFFIGLFFILFSFLFEFFNTNGKFKNPFDNKHSQGIAAMLFAPTFYAWLLMIVVYLRKKPTM